MVRRTKRHLHIGLSIEATAPASRHRFSQTNLANTRDDSDHAGLRVAHRPTAVRIALSNMPRHT